MIKAMIVDDQTLLKESLLFILGQDSSIEAYDGGANGYDALEKCETIKPDIILMDIRMPEMNGITATQKIKDKYPNIKVIILTTFEDDESIKEAIRSGADGYIVKDIKPEALLLAVKSAHQDLFVMHKGVFGLINNALESLAIEKQMSSEAIDAHGLTSKELRIIQLMVDGKSNREIAEILSFTEGTVKNKVSRILSKLYLKDRTQLVAYAIKNNLS